MKTLKPLILTALFALSPAWASGTKAPGNEGPSPALDSANPNQVDLQTILELAVAERGSVGHFTTSLQSFLRTSAIGAAADVTSISGRYHRSGDPINKKINPRERGPLAYLLNNYEARAADPIPPKPIEAYQAQMNPNFLRALWNLPLRVYAKYKTLDYEMCEELERPLSLLNILLPKITPANAARFGFDPATFREWALLVKGLDIAYEGGYSSCHDAFVLAVGAFEDFVIEDFHGYHRITCSDSPEISRVGIAGGGSDYVTSVKVIRVTEIFDIGIWRSITCDLGKNGFLKPRL